MLVLAGGDEPVLVWHQVLLLVVQVCGEFWRVENVKGNDVGQGSPLLVNWTVPRQVYALEAWELVFLVLIHAQGDLLSRDLGNLPLSNNFLDALLQAVASVDKLLDITLKILELEVLSNQGIIV